MNRRSMARSLMLLVLFSVVSLLVVQPARSALQPSQTISTVDQEAITVEAFQQRYSFERWLMAFRLRELWDTGDYEFQEFLALQAQALELMADPQFHAESVLDQMEHELVIKHAAEERNIVVDQTVVDEWIQAYLLSFVPEAIIQRALREASASDDLINSAYSISVLEQTLRDQITADIPTEEIHVYMREIFVAFFPEYPYYTKPEVSDKQRAETLARAEAVLDALHEGQSFESLVTSYPDIIVDGKFGWVRESALDEAIRNAEIGSIVGPLETANGYVIAEVADRELRPVAPAILIRLRDDAFAAWLEAELATVDIIRTEGWERLSHMTRCSRIFSRNGSRWPDRLCCWCCFQSFHSWWSSPRGPHSNPTDDFHG